MVGLDGFEVEKTYEDANQTPFLHVKAFDDHIDWQPGKNPTRDELLQGKPCVIKRGLFNPVTLQYRPDKRLLNIDNVHDGKTAVRFTIIQPEGQTPRTPSAILKTVVTGENSYVSTQINYQINNIGPTRVKFDFNGKEITDGISNITYTYDVERKVPVISNFTINSQIITDSKQLAELTQKYGFPETIPLTQSREMLNQITQLDNTMPILPQLKVIGLGNHFTDLVGLTQPSHRPTTVRIIERQSFIKK